MIEPKSATDAPAMMIVFEPVPNHTIISGAKADFGSELSTTKYGSIILLRVFDDIRIIAIIILSTLTIIKLIKVSNSVIPV